MGVISLDKRDMKIINILAKNPDISQEEIARQLGISQPAVALRIRKLRDAGALVKYVGVDPFKLDLYIAKVEASANDPDKVFDIFRNCPFFLNGFVTSGRRNLCLFLSAENPSTIESIVSKRLKSDSIANGVELDFVMSSARSVVISKRFGERSYADGRPPCNCENTCPDCRYYQNGFCVGCPAVGYYRGKLVPIKSKKLVAGSQ